MFRHLVVLYRLRQAKSAVYLLAFWSSHPHAAQVHCHAKFASIRNLNAIKDRPARRLDFPSALSVVLGPTSPHHSPDNAGAKGTEKAKKSEKIAKSCFSQPNYASTVLNLHCERLLSIDKSFAKIVCTTILQNVSLFNGMSTVNKVSGKKRRKPETVYDDNRSLYPRMGGGTRASTGKGVMSSQVKVRRVSDNLNCHARTVSISPPTHEDISVGRDPFISSRAKTLVYTSTKTPTPQHER
jgi:hypothetical protein